MSLDFAIVSLTISLFRVRACDLLHRRRMTRSFAGSHDPSAPTTTASTTTLWNRRSRSCRTGSYLVIFCRRASSSAARRFSKGQQTSMMRASSPRTSTRSGRRLVPPTGWFS
uniref:Putative secreted protein n=1 Tax=Ixodes ricinus TaxID=34613 RepID=A0A147BLW2_IXORI